MFMIEPYMAVALQTSFRGVRDRKEIKVNLEHIYEVMSAAIWLTDVEMPVRLVALAEGALQGFTDEVFDMDHLEYYEKIAIDIPGEETDRLGEMAKTFNTYIIAQARGKNPDFPDRYFNIAFIVDPRGKVIHKYHKLQVYVKEHSTTPHDIWDLWVEKYGCNLNAFFPVADTEIGRIGTMICQDAEYPETARGLAMNGAEIIYRGAEAEPLIGRGWWEIQNRARALDNTCYVIAPNIGPYYLTVDSNEPVNVTGGSSMIVDYHGQIIGRGPSYGDGWAAAPIYIEALREYRLRATNGNWIRDLRTEIYKLIYEEPIWPKNLAIEKPPGKHADSIRLAHEVTERLIRRGVWKKPSSIP